MDYNFTKTRFKMYKSGKMWVVMGATFMGVNMATPAFADEVPAINNKSESIHKVSDDKAGIHTKPVEPKPTEHADLKDKPVVEQKATEKLVHKQEKTNDVKASENKKHVSENKPNKVEKPSKPVSKLTKHDDRHDNRDKDKHGDRDKHKDKNPQGLTISDADYPKMMDLGKFENKAEYKFQLLVSGDKRRKLILTSNRSGDGTIHVYYMIWNGSRWNHQNQFTLTKNRSVTAADGYYNEFTIHNDDFGGLIQFTDRWSRSFDFGAYDPSQLVNNITFFVPKIIKQRVHYVDEAGKVISEQLIQNGLTGQKYTTPRPKKIEGYDVEEPKNADGTMSQFGEIGAKYVRNFHDGTKIVFTQLDDEGTMRAEVYDVNDPNTRGQRPSYTVTVRKGETAPEKYFKFNRFGIRLYNYWLMIVNPYVQQTQDIKYVYKKRTLEKEVHTIKRTVKPVDKTGKQVAPDIIEEITFEREGIKNNVTGEIEWQNWTSINDSFGDVKAPKVEGMMPNRPVVPGQTVTPDMTDFVEHIVYEDKISEVKESKSIEREIKYIDKNGKEVAPSTKEIIEFNRTGTKNDVTGAIIWNDWTSTQDAFESVDSPKVENMTPNRPTVDGQKVQPGDKDIFEKVVYEDNHSEVFESKTVEREIKYVDSKGNEVAPSTKEVIEFNRTGTKNDVTGEIIWNEWTSTQDAFESVDSPKVENMTPSRPKVDGITVKPGDKDIFEKVVYEDNHSEVSESKKVEREIKYVDSKGNEVAPSTKEIIEFNRTGTKNHVTGEIIWNDWIASEDGFKSVNSPVVENMTPNRPTVDGITVKPGDKDIFEKVVYEDNHSEVSESKKIEREIKYVDSKGNEVAPSTKEIIEFNRTGTKNDVTGEIIWNDWIASEDGFKSVDSPKIENMTPNRLMIDGQKVQPGDKDIFEKVVYEDNHSEVSESKKVEREIKYVDSKGNEVAPSTKEVIEFNRTGTKNDVTGEIIWNDWIASEEGFKSVDSPKVENMTPSRPKVDGITVKPGDKDIFEKVVYEDNHSEVSESKKVEREIKYVDCHGNEVAPSTKEIIEFDRTGIKNDVTGEIEWQDWTSPHNGCGSIQSPKIENMTPDRLVVEGVTVTPEDKDIFEKVVYEDNHSEVSESKKVEREIKYVDKNGKEVAPSTKEIIEFNRTGTKNDVTGEIEWNDWTSTQDGFGSVTVPNIDGMIPNRTHVDGQVVSPDSANILEEVVYEIEVTGTTGNKSESHKTQTQNEDLKSKTRKQVELPNTGMREGQSVRIAGVVGLSALMGMIGQMVVRKRK